MTRVVLAVVILAILWSGIAYAAALPYMHVGRVQVGYKAVATTGYLIWATVTVHDMEHMPLPGAGVTVQWTEPSGIRVTGQAVTNFQGQAKFQILSAMPGLYHVAVTDVAKFGWVYNPRLNEQTSAKLQVPRVICIDGSCPPPVLMARQICIDGKCPTPVPGPTTS